MSSTPAGPLRAEPLSEPLGVDLVRRGLSAELGRDPRSLPAALRGRDGLVHGLVDAEDLRQSGDLQDLQDPLLRADQIQRFRRRRSPQLLVYGVQQLGRSHALGRSGP
jgi:hypothetical protein